MKEAKLSRIAAAAAAFRARWEALPAEARVVATEAVIDAASALRTLRALPPEVPDAATAIAKEAVAVWLKPFASTAKKVAKLREAAAQLPPELGDFLCAVLDSFALEGNA